MASVEHKDATQIHKGRYIQTADPGAVGTGVEWLDTNTSPAIHKKRNAADDGWDEIIDPADYALLASPTFTGTPAAPTAAPGTGTTQIATTEYVDDAVAAGVADGDKGDLTVSSSGTVWTIDNGAVTPAKSSNALRDVALPVVIGNGSDVITTGVKGYVEIPFACTIVAVRLVADQSGSIVIDVWKDTYANFPPVNADSIAAAALPTLSAALKAEDTTLTGWTTTITAGDWLGFNVDSATTVTQVTLSLTLRKS